MAYYLLRRTVQAALVLWAAFTLAFVVLFSMPSDPVRLLLNSGGGGNVASSVAPEQIAALEKEFGLNRPILEQYFSALFGYFRGDFGLSMQTRQPVLDEILKVLPDTAQLAASAFVVAIVGGALVALASTYTRMGWLRQFLLALPSVGASVPAFWFGLVLIQIFSFNLGLLPAVGNKGFTSLILPTLALALPIGAAVAQIFARSLRTAMAEPYTATAVAKGASRPRVLLMHAARNAAIPPLTMIGLLVGQLIANATVTETVFSRQGIGRLTISAVNRQDMPLLLGIVVLSAFVFVTSSLIVDLVYTKVDPRVDVRLAKV